MERALIQQAVQGDVGALTNLITLYDRRVYRVAFSYLKNQDEAMDVCQEVFLRLSTKLDTYRQDRPFFPWLYQITKNLCLSRIGSSSYRTESLGDRELSAQTRTPEGELIEKEEVAEIQKSLASLPEKFRTILELKHFQECSYKEISEILGIPEGTVMSRLYHARKALRDVLAKGVSS